MVSLTVVKAKRMTRGVTQKDVARCVGVTDQAVCAVETGYHPASDNMQEKLANYFECERSDLFDAKTGRAVPLAI